jgi:CheY-like chemotaxis protein
MESSLKWCYTIVTPCRADHNRWAAEFLPGTSGIVFVSSFEKRVAPKMTLCFFFMGGDVKYPFDVCGGSMNSEKPLILVVDDDATIRLLLRAALVHEEYDVVDAENGLMALDLVRRRMPDLIFLDLKMPVMSGYEFLKKYQEQFSKRAPVVVVSGVDDIALRVSDLGAVDFLEKPFHIEHVLEKAVAHIARG